VLAQRLAAVELTRLSGTKDYNLKEFGKTYLKQSTGKTFKSLTK
jgi:hypothetical protein